MKTNNEIAEGIVDAPWGEGDTGLRRRIALALDAKDQEFRDMREEANKLLDLSEEARKVAECKMRDTIEELRKLHQNLRANLDIVARAAGVY